MTKKKYRNTAEIIRDKNLEKQRNKYAEIIKNMSTSESDENDIDLTGKTVRILHEDYDKRIENGEMSSRFIEWYNENKDKEFVVSKKVRGSFLSPYRLENVSDWDFYDANLELVE